MLEQRAFNLHKEMHARIIFCVAVTLAILTVILLAVLSPVPHAKHPAASNSKPSLALSLYIQKPPPSTTLPRPAATPMDGAVVFHRSLTEGPESTSPVIGKAQGFIIPVEHFADAAFNIIYLTFETPQYSGSLSVQAKKAGDDDGEEEFRVVGGSGAFAFARGVAVFVEADHKKKMPSSDVNVGAAYHVKLQLSFGNHSRMIPG